MATREENLKKINEQLELMSDDELDKVAGGGIYLWSIEPNKNPNTDTDSNPFITNGMIPFGRKP